MNMPKLMRLLPMLTMVASLAYATYSMQPVGLKHQHQYQARHERPDETASRRQGRPAHAVPHPSPREQSRSARPRSEIRFRL